MTRKKENGKSKLIPPKVDIEGVLFFGRNINI